MPRALVAASLVVVACSTSSSRLDSMAGSDKLPAPSSNDPWAVSSKPSGSSDRPGKPGAGDDGGLGGFDLQGTLQKIGDGIKKPGPYEAPDKSAGYDAAKPHWGVLALDGGVVERRAFSLLGGGGTELRALAERLRELAGDDALTGVVLRVGGLDVSLPDVVELRRAIHALRDARKTVACHAEDASNAGYLVLAACDRIALAPLGTLAITGPSAMPIHVKPLLDKLGVQADFLHVGAYKGAAEPLTRDAPSKEMEETLGAILDRRYATMTEIIAAERKLEPAAVRTLIDTALFPAEQAQAARLVDEVAAFEAFRDGLVAAQPWTKLELRDDGDGKLAAMLKVARFLGAMPPDKPMGKHAALVYALGTIGDGDGRGVLGARQEIASHTLVAALHALAEDDDVRAVVLRIDSGGGSAQASELIWRAVAELKAKKPVVVSMSDVAASGGYYIACGATKIFALDDTLTGSIGVVGGKLAPGGALAKLGVHAFPMGRGKRATMMASLGPWTDDERGAIQATMEDVYRRFVGRVAEGRGKTPAQVEELARGRVWTGAKARELGLVDAIGGLDDAIAEAGKLGKVDTSDLEVYPPAPTLRDLIQGIGEVSAPLGLGASAALDDLGAPGAAGALDVIASLDPQLAGAARRLLGLVASFRATPIQAIAILPEVR